MNNMQPANQDININLGVYTAIKNADGYFMFTIPKKVSKGLDLEGGETFIVSYNTRFKTLEYRREDVDPKQKRKRKE